MQTIDIIKKQVNLKEFIRRGAKESDYLELIKEDTLITENGVPKILYFKLKDTNTDSLREVIQGIGYNKSARSSGLISYSRVFGFNPRHAIRRDYCSATGLSIEKPLHHAEISNFGEVISRLYKQHFPEVFKNHSDIVNEKISGDWKIKDTPFTSGIVNKNNPLKYHFDSGNIKGVLSNMVVFKKNSGGGFLSCPQYDIGFECADNTIILFDGQDILHGVTPIQNKASSSYRYSVVYYTLEQMWKCEPLSDEIKRARKKHFDKEKRRANNQIGALNIKP
jgi:hypothetical protein